MGPASSPRARAPYRRHQDRPPHGHALPPFPSNFLLHTRRQRAPQRLETRAEDDTPTSGGGCAWGPRSHTSAPVSSPTWSTTCATTASAPSSAPQYCTMCRGMCFLSSRSRYRQTRSRTWGISWSCSAARAPRYVRRAQTTLKTTGRGGRGYLTSFQRYLGSPLTGEA